MVARTWKRTAKLFHNVISRRQSLLYVKIKDDKVEEVPMSRG